MLPDSCAAISHIRVIRIDSDRAKIFSGVTIRRKNEPLSSMVEGVHPLGGGNIEKLLQSTMKVYAIH